MQIIILPSAVSRAWTYRLSWASVLRLLLVLLVLCIACSALFYRALWSNDRFLGWVQHSHFVQLISSYHAALHLSPYEQTALGDRIILIAKRLQVLEVVSHDIQRLLNVDLNTLDQKAMDSDFSEEEVDVPVLPVSTALSLTAAHADDAGTD